ncbi:MAG: outer membrane beta-barrel protein [Flavitalea sp.]
MKRIFALITGICIAMSAIAQQDSTAKTDTAPSDTVSNRNDTLLIGNIIIIRRDRSGKDSLNYTAIFRRKKYKPSNLSTNWGIIDLGFSQVNDKTDYAASIASGYLPAGANEDWFNQRNFKSTNVNIWIMMQRLNMIKQIVNLKYGLGMEFNNYKYTENIKFQKTSLPLAVMSSNNYRKNKLVANYLTVPIMLNFNFTPAIRKGFGISAGISAGFLYSSYQKIKDGEESGKVKYRDDFDLQKFKIAYVTELNMGPIRLYGSFATKSMFKKALDQTPFNFGLRLSNW